MTQEILDKLIIAEGGYKLTNVKNDRGGETYAGISKRANPYWEGWATLDGCHPNEDVPEEIVNALKPLVRDLYFEKYWKAAGLNKAIWVDYQTYTEVAELQELLFHISVLSGSKISIYCLQNSLGGISVDGIWGPKTAEKLHKELEDFISQTEKENNNIECISRGIALVMINRFVRIVQNDRSQGKFLLGWCARFLKLLG